MVWLVVAAAGILIGVASASVWTVVALLDGAGRNDNSLMGDFEFDTDSDQTTTPKIDQRRRLSRGYRH